MPRKPKADHIPNDWQQRVREHIKSRPVERCPVEMRVPMVQWLDDDRVRAAAGILWKASKDNSKIRENFHVLIYNALAGIAIGSIYQPLPNWTKRKYENIVDALNEAAGHPLSPFSPNTKKEIEVAAILFRALGERSPETRPREDGLQVALVHTCRHFLRVLGDPTYEAVGMLLEVGFRKAFCRDTVRARYSEWGKKFPEQATS